MWNTKNPKIIARKKLIRVRKLKSVISEILAGFVFISTLGIWIIVIYLLG